MEIESLLQAQSDEDSFRVDFMKVDWKDFKIKTNKKQGVELTEMGQSYSRNNKITDWIEEDQDQENRFSSSVLKLEINEILELKAVFKRLASLSPEDQFMSKQTFLHYFPLEGKLGERLFRVFDRDNDGRIDAYEFLSGISLCLRGSLSNKCELLFNMFDLNGDEGVSQDELFSMLKPTLKAADSLSRKPSKDSAESKGEDFSEVARLLVHEAFEECDLEQTGKLSSEGFQKWLANHKELVKAIFSSPFQSVMRRRKFEELKPEAVRNRRIQPQTWMNEFNENDSWNESEPSDNLENAIYLWSPIFPKTSAKFPPSRLKHANVLYNGQIFIFGGRGKSATLKDIWIYRIGENVWSSVEHQDGAKPSVLQEHAAVVYKDNAYIFGGAFTTDDSTPFWSYNFDTSTWKSLSRRKFQKEPSNRRSHTAAVYRDSMYIFGGYLDSGVSTNDIWQYNFSTFRWRLLTPQSGSDVISARHSHTSVVHNHALWVFGGLDKSGRKNDLWRWNFELSVWSRIRCRNSPPVVAGHTCSKVGCLMVVFGGESNTDLRNETWTFNFESCKWTKITPFSSISPTIRSHHTAVVLNPYSIHSGLVRVSRPNTTKSAPDSTNYDRLARNGSGLSHRVASADSIIDYHQRRVVKGKSLDLQLQLDNDGYDRSFPDVSCDEMDNHNFWSSEFSTESDINNDCGAAETSFVQSAGASGTDHINWGIIIIGGRGKHSSDMYKTTVDIWKCDIGQDIGAHYQVKTISVKEQHPQPIRLRSQTAKPRVFKTEDKTFENDSREMKQKLITKESKLYDKLIITDLTTDNEESELASSRWETKNLLR